MKENYLHFLSKTPSTISINGYNIGTIDNENTFELDICTKTDNIFVNYEPVSDKCNYLPYSAKIRTSTTPNTDNQYIEVVPFPNNHYDIIMKPFYYYELKDAKVLLNKNFGNYFVSIISSHYTTVTIYSGSSMVYQTAIPLLSNATAELKKDLLIIKGIISEDEYYLLILNTTTFETIFSDIVHSIDETDTYIEGLKKLNNLPRHAVVCKIEYSPFKKEIFNAYEREQISIPNNKYFVPLFFLDALKIGDEKLIKETLSGKLLTSPIAKFQSYFGNIEKVYFNRHYTGHDVNVTIKSNGYKNYNFNIVGGKIDDIDEVNIF